MTAGWTEGIRERTLHHCGYPIHSFPLPKPLVEKKRKSGTGNSRRIGALTQNARKMDDNADIVEIAVAEILVNGEVDGRASNLLIHVPIALSRGRAAS